jgi:subtilisin-like proprotein convertase family protein
MSAAGVSGMLALMEEFFERRVGVTNSPALMKALVINGARSIGNYNLGVQNTINFQGWGLVNLTNTIQQALAVQSPNPVAAAKYYFDQNPSMALATGESRTYSLKVNPDGQQLPLRITLAWTDPPGNPIASLKLVNDLDLVVTNTDNSDPLQQDVFFGNDIQSGNDFNLPWDTNTAPNIDYVNNVENVYLLPPLGTNYSITVRAKRVNVNALTVNGNNTVQDYALVISSGDGETNTALSLGSSVSGLVATNAPTIITNDFVESPTDFGQIISLQQAGANTPLLGTNTLSTLPLGKQGQEVLFDGRLTVGLTNQWHFYVFTNNSDPPFTNVAFVVLNAATKSVPRMGTWQFDPANATTIYPDVDLYVSTDPGLLTLQPGAILGADKSLSRGGDEAVIYTNAGPGTVYYIAVKSESQEAVEYTFFGDSSPIPFGSQDEQGNFHGIGHPAYAPIPDDNADGADILVLAFGRTMPKLVKRAVATNTISHELMGDLVGTVSHGGTKDFAVLNNHAPDTPVIRQTFLYDDSGHVSGARRTDGPGSLVNFQGKGASGIWRLREVDDAFGHVGTNEQFGLFLENEPDLGQGVNFELLPTQCDYAFFTVPPNATNLTLQVSLTNGTGPLSVTICRFDGPLCAAGCKSQIVYSNAVITLGLNDEPPINAGTYIVTFCNLGPNVLQGTLGPLKFQLGPGLNSPKLDFTGGPIEVLDDAVTYSTIQVGNVGCMRTVEVGLRIDHPRVSDLMLHLIAPDGTRVLLDQNRGALTTNGMGYTVTSTNIIPVSSAGGPQASTNVIDTGQTSGSISISYDFFSIPDDMSIYYQGVLIWDSGLISGSGTTNISFGPGVSTFVTIIMNQGGNPDTNTLWDYTVTSTSADYFYLTFTENTNLTSTPMKFAVPPFYNLPGSSSNVLISGFESAAAGYYAPTSFIEGWSVVSNRVNVTTNPAAHTGTKSLALLNGAIQTNLPTLPNHKYQVKFAYEQTPAMQGIVSWWRGDGNALDSVSGNNGALTGNVTYGPGEVNGTFIQDGLQDAILLGNPANLQLQNFTIETWAKRTSPTQVTRLGNNNDSVFLSYGSSGYGFGLDHNGRPLLTKIDISGVTANIIVADTNWHHLAMTKSGTSVIFYVDGVAYPTTYSTTFTFGTPVAIGARGDTLGNSFWGRIDELAFFNRALSAAEIQSIYAVGAAGKCGLIVSPAACSGSGQTMIDGQFTGGFNGATNWQTNIVSFTAAGSSTTFAVAGTGFSSRALLDTFTFGDLGGPDYVLPEESLDKVAGLDPFGDWRLEIADTRVGATNPTPTLVRWQLSLIMENTTPAPVALLHHVPVTNSVGPGQIRYFTVDVPYWASFASNRLLNASGQVNLLFNQVTWPTGTNVGDFTLLANSTGGVNTLSTNGTPALIPGATYRLGVQNVGVNPVTFALEVDFDVTPLTNGIPVTGIMMSNSVPRYFSYDVRSNESAVFFQLTNLTGNVDLYVRDGLPFPGPGDADYGSFNFGTNNEVILVVTNGEPVPLKPGRWYLGVFNADVTNVNYTIVVTDITNGGPGVVTLTNKAPYIKSGLAAGDADYYRYVVSAGMQRAQFELQSSSGPATLLARRGALATMQAYDYISVAGTNAPMISLFSGGGVFQLQPGEWYLSVVNGSATPVDYTIMASEFAVSGTNIFVTGEYLSRNPANGSNNFCLGWNSVGGLYYYVEGKVALSDPQWTTVSALVTGGETQTSWCVPLPSPYHFFRVRQWLGAAAPGATSLPSTMTISRETNGIVIRWSGPNTNVYQVQWTASLSAASWQSFSNNVTSATGAFSFTDDGTQSGGLGPTRFYRLVRLP